MWRRVVGSLLYGSLLMGATAHADTLLDFGIITPTTGSISYAGGGAPLVGLGIDVDIVTSLPSGTSAACSGCVLNFTTGDLTGSTATSWDFGGSPLSSITIVGTVRDAGITTSTVLLTGHFGSASVRTFGTTFKIAGASFEDTQEADLLTYLGWPSGLYTGNFNISFVATGSPSGAFTSTTVLSGDVVHAPVPEAASTVLLGSALAAIAYLARRWRWLAPRHH